MKFATSLESYRLLGRSGLRVSPLALGTMTFGQDWGWGCPESEARRIFDAYTERGGNFIDTANMYTEGTAEKFIGRFAAGNRDRLVISTKFGLGIATGDPNASGNHRKCMVRAVESSLRRLSTDYIDLLYLHAWDSTASTDEVLRGMDDLVRSGKVLYVGISGTAAWQIAQMQTTATLRGWTPLVAVQIEYNLIERTAERELIPMANALGIGVVSSSPLASGALSGKYTKADLQPAEVPQEDGSRRRTMIVEGGLTERGLQIAEIVRIIAEELGRTPSQVALAWALVQPSVCVTTLGARTREQLEDNIAALKIDLTAEQRKRLEQASSVELGLPHEHVKKLVEGGYMLDTHVLQGPIRTVQ